MDWEIISKYVLPPLLGGLAGTLAVFANWRIERARKRFEHRQALVHSWRTELLRHMPDQGDTFNLNSGENGLKYEFMRLPEYASIRSHLDPEFVKTLEAERHIVVGSNYPRNRFIIEIARIERMWGLV